jgi:hypothetical protein
MYPKISPFAREVESPAAASDDQVQAHDLSKCAFVSRAPMSISLSSGNAMQAYALFAGPSDQSRIAHD